MNYTLHQLQIFLKVSQTGSITKAARKLHLSEPAVSIQLKNFQEQFSIPLTETIGRTIHITEFGHEVATAAENIWNEVQAINLKTYEYKNQLTGRLRISSVSTGKYVMPNFPHRIYKTTLRSGIVPGCHQQGEGYFQPRKK